MPEFWIGGALLAAVLGFIIGQLTGRRERRLALGGLLVAPVLAFTVALALTPPAPPSFTAWWLAGMVMIVPAMVAWALLSVTGFLLAWASGR